MTSVIKSVRQNWHEEDVDSPEAEVMTAEVDPSMMTGEAEKEVSELPLDMSEWTAEQLAAYNALRSKRKKCCIGGCTHRSLPIAKSYHQLPVRNQDIWKKWVEIIRWSRNDVEWMPNGDAAPLVCSRHFPDSDFISYEASSRVRLSHTAIPVYFIDPPEGTVMDPRFSDPPPIPPMNSIARQNKEQQGPSPKMKRAKLDDEYYNNDEIGGQYSSSNSRNGFSPDKYDDVADSPNYVDNVGYGYDIEEVNDNSYDGYIDSYGNRINYEHQPRQTMPLNFSKTQQRRLSHPTPSQPGTMKLSGNRNSVPPSLINFSAQQQNQNQFRNNNPNVKNKLPALIKADDIMQVNKLMIQRQSKSSTVQGKPLIVEGGLKSILNKDIKSSINRPNPPQKHKIGLAKCRLIIQTLENEMRIAEMRLAEQLGVPIQVIRGVWNMKDSIKDKM